MYASLSHWHDVYNYILIYTTTIYYYVLLYTNIYYYVLLYTNIYYYVLLYTNIYYYYVLLLYTTTASQGLLACVIKEGIINRRLETFARICGITLDGHKEGYSNYSESQISYYFHAMGVIFGQNLSLLTQCMNSFVSNITITDTTILILFLIVM